VPVIQNDNTHDPKLLNHTTSMVKELMVMAHIPKL